MILSRNGVQQGDPCGPAVFCIALHRLLPSLESEFKPWFLDDGTLAGSLDSVLTDIQRVRDFSRVSDLELNFTKCELFTLSEHEEVCAETLRRIRRLLPDARLLYDTELELLGAPLNDLSVQGVLTRKKHMIDSWRSRLPLLDAHPAVYLMRCSLSSPRLTYVMRCCDTSAFRDLLVQMDDGLRQCLSVLLNLNLLEFQQ